MPTRLNMGPQAAPGAMPAMPLAKGRTKHSTNDDWAWALDSLCKNFVVLPKVWG